jgi:nitrogen fixation NifU-like protein
VYSPRLLEHFRNPRNVGELAAPAITVEVSNPACGDLLRVWVRFQGDRIAEVRYKARGCTASIAVGSALTEWMHGQTRAALAALQPATLEEAVGGLPPQSRHAAALAVAAAEALLRITPAASGVEPIR